MRKEKKKQVSDVAEANSLDNCEQTVLSRLLNVSSDGDDVTVAGNMVVCQYQHPLNSVTFSMAHTGAGSPLILEINFDYYNQIHSSRQHAAVIKLNKIDTQMHTMTQKNLQKRLVQGPTAGVVWRCNG